MLIGTNSITQSELCAKRLMAAEKKKNRVCLSVASGESASGKYHLDAAAQKSDELICEGGFLSGLQSQVKTRIMKHYSPRGLLLLCVNSERCVISAFTAPNIIRELGLYISYEDVYIWDI